MPSLSWYVEHRCPQLFQKDMIPLDAIMNAAAFQMMHALTHGIPCTQCSLRPGCATWEDLRQETLAILHGKPLPPSRIPTHAQAEDVNALLRDPDFLEACKRAGVEPTRRQANKFLRQEGAAYDHRVRA